MACISQIDAGLTSLRDLLPLFRHQQEERGKAFIHELILHSNSIRALDPPLLSMLGSLRVLDLSSNQIDNMLPLGALTGLVDLNLSNNLIQTIEGLWKLQGLTRLILSFNRIKTLDGMVDLHGNHHCLKELDLKGNEIANLDELTFLVGCTSLKHLVLQGDLTSPGMNRFLTDPKYSNKGVFNVLPQLQSLDQGDRLGNPCVDSMDFEFFLDDGKIEHNRSTELQTKKPHTDVSDRLSQIETHLVNLSNKKPVATSPLPNEFLMEQMHMLEQKINRLQSGQSLQTVKDDTAMEKAPIELKIESLERKILDIINNQHNGQAHNNPEFAEFLEWKKHKSKTTKEDKENDEKHNETPEISKPQKTAKKIILRDKPTRETEIKMKANEKLIHALEQEEKRLLDNEQRYAEEVKRLKDELDSTKLILETANAKMLDDESTISTLNDALRFEKDAVIVLEGRLRDTTGRADEFSKELREVKLNLENVTQVASEHKKLSATLQSDLKEAEFDMSQLRKSHSALEIETHQLSQKLKVSEDEKNRISMRYFKEREASKIALAEMKVELDFNRNDKVSLQENLKNMEEQYRAIEAKHHGSIEILKSNHNASLEHNTAVKLQSAMEKHREDLRDARTEAQNARSAYYQLEKDFKERLNYECDKSVALKESYAQLTKQYKSLEENFMGQSQKMAEHKQLIRELTDLAKDQKAELRELHHRHQVTVAMFEEKSQEADTLQRQISELTATADDLKTRNQDLKAAASEKSREINMVKNESQALHQKVYDLSMAITREKPVLEEKLHAAQEKISKLEKQLEASEQAIKIKTKMLEDQNESIKKLKQNLENKVRESSQTTTELAKRELALQAQLDAEHRCQADLKADIETQEGVIKHFQDIVQDYNTERHKLKNELAHVMDALRKRNESIGLIETEVVKVKEYFKKRESQLVDEKEEALKRKDMDHLEMHLTFEAQSGKLAIYEKEREGLVDKIRSQESELDSLTKTKCQLETEVQILVRELDHQQARMDEKLAKIKAAFAL